MSASEVQTQYKNDPNQDTVLVIEDEKQVQEAIRDILELINLNVLTASNGEQGIKIFSARRAEIRLLLLDMSMPGLSSVETFQTIRKIAPTLPILITSGISAAELPLAIKADPKSEFLQKPFSLNTIIERVQFHLANST